MPSHSARRRPFSTLPARRLLTGLALALAAAPSTATAAPVRDVVQPLAVMANGARPACASPVAPYEPSDLLALQTNGYSELDASESGADVAAEVGALRKSMLILPSVAICSPTFGGLPGPITGTVAAGPLRSRVGPGWREFGGTFVAPAPLTPGDVLSLPEVDDVARVALRVATSPGQPAASLALSDLSPGPSRLAVSRDGRGLVATLTRGDGSVAEAVTPPTVVPALAPRFSAKGRRWTMTTKGLPGGVLFAIAYSRGTRTGGSFVRVPASGETATPLTFLRPVRPRRSVYVSIATLDRTSGSLATLSCSVKTSSRRRPTLTRCARDGESDIGDVLYDLGEVKASPFSAAAAGAARALDAQAALSRISRVLPGTAPLARRHPIRGRSASAAPAAAPLVARPIGRAPGIRTVAFGGLRPLAADVNGDAQPDFWTDDLPDSGDWRPISGSTAGYVLISSPEGLEPHRVDLARIEGEDSVSDREISAIEDITGDGIGELVVDLDERHGLIPGSRSWTSTTFPIQAPDPADLGPDDLLLAPGASSPGSPYGTLDDVTGDGRRELVATDDLGGWLTVSSQDLRPGAMHRLPSAARSVATPSALFRTATFDASAPRVDPRLRVIAGQALMLRWPVVASRKAPQGTVEIAVRDAWGALVRPLMSVRTPGNALLLDHDRASGDSLLLSVAPACLVRRNQVPHACRETLVRARADGTVRHSVTVDPFDSILSAGAARFIKDGPDAGDEVDVVTTVGNAGLALLESGRTGVMTEEDLPITKVQNATPYYDEVRLIPVFGPQGDRRLTAALGQPVRESRNYVWTRSAAVPTEIVWK